MNKKNKEIALFRLSVLGPFVTSHINLGSTSRPI